jgi:hypothetical protein
MAENQTDKIANPELGQPQMGAPVWIQYYGCPYLAYQTLDGRWFDDCTKKEPKDASNFDF